jgi:predicted membrane-bound dolichyl-phosphate-mannose-protein mannosyltransferase
MLLSFLLYLNHKYALSGLSLALAVLCTPKAVLAVFVILAHWFFVRRKSGRRDIGIFAVTSLLVFFVVLPITDFFATGQWFNPFQRAVEMWTDQTAVKVGDLTPDEIALIHATRPWEWILRITAGARLNPLEFRHTMGLSPTTWLLIIPSMIYLLYRQIFVKENKATSRFVLLWFAATYLLWIPLELLTDRTMFLYYLLPTMGAICIAIGYALHRVWQRSVREKRLALRWAMRAVVVLYVVVHLGTFTLMSPLSLALVQAGN